MSYLDYAEFTELTGSELDEQKFKRLLPKATVQLDGLTNDFYSARYVLEAEYKSDYPLIRARATTFKQALGATVEYMDETGITSRSDVANVAQGGVSIGRTRVEGPDYKKSLAPGWVVPVEYYALLGRHGLLYRGL